MTAPKQLGSFEKVGECLYRYSTSGSYYAVIRHQGKLIRRSLGTTDKPLAKRRLSELRQDLGRIDFKAGRVTVAEMADRYHATIQHLAPKTIANKATMLKRVKSEWPGGSAQLVRDVRESHVKTFLGLQRQKRGKASYNSYVETVRGMFALSVADKLIAHSPASSVKEVKRDTPIRETPTVEQFHKIVESIRSQPLNAQSEESADYVEFLGLAGIGNAEAAALRWRDVDLDGNRIRLMRVKTVTGFVIPIYPQLRPLLDKLHLRASGDPDEKVLKIMDAKKALAAACKRLGLQSFTHRSFRRMFIVRCIELGIDVKVISQWQGHRDGGKLILQTYSHVRQPHADEMAKKLV